MGCIRMRQLFRELPSGLVGARTLVWHSDVIDHGRFMPSLV